MPDASTKSSTMPQDAAGFLARYPETKFVDAFYADLCGIIRGKRYPAEQLDKLLGDGLACTGSAMLLDALGTCHDPKGMGISDGDPDFLLKAIPGSLVPVPWAKLPTAQLMTTFSAPDGTPYLYDPRNVLTRVLARVAELELRPVVAFELEFYLLDRERLADGSPQPPVSPLTGKRLTGTQVYSVDEIEAFAELLDDMTRACDAQGIATGAITAEYAPGQFEINLQHLDDPMRAADQCVMFKRIVKGVAQKHGIEATFMPKPYPSRAGSGLHMHCSLLDKRGRNVFSAGKADPSDKLRHAIGGILDLMPDCMGILAPNMNAMRRLVPNIFVPVTRSWGFENRSVALRIPHGGPEARRIEHRIGGADANPYLALASLLAGLHLGITQAIEPGPATEGNAGKTADPEIPFRLHRALDRMRESERLADYFTKDYVEAYVACKLAELAKFESVVSPAEYAWYLQTD